MKDHAGFMDAGISDDTLDLILAESDRQRELRGIQIHTLYEWHTHTTEELGELANAISEAIYRGGSWDHVVDEAIQVATIALKIAKMCGG